ncbi:hypothetical protein IWQ60_007268 [Tieghemiomyces parasiticus]|uniref:Uncharacterized protein n=1 Tax=Tieghemiomyces parasiticus TaxID=78921 RepID=A0A9W8DUZ1_9FUNG|nr:hypothetical protein IWQ60_007268 [Tieghemiomyces parasiticus]
MKSALFFAFGALVLQQSRAAGQVNNGVPSSTKELPDEIGKHNPMLKQPQYNQILVRRGLVPSQELTPFQDDLEDNAEPLNQHYGEENVPEAEVISLTKEFVNEIKSLIEVGDDVTSAAMEFIEAFEEANQLAGEVNQVDKGLYLKAAEFVRDGKVLIQKAEQVEKDRKKAAEVANKCLLEISSTKDACDVAVAAQNAYDQAASEAKYHSGQAIEEARLAREAYDQATDNTKQAAKAVRDAVEAFEQATDERERLQKICDSDLEKLGEEFTERVGRFFDEASELIDGPKEADPMA